MEVTGQIKKIQVAAYSGYKANERPLYFLIEGQKKNVVKIVDRWYGTEHDYFKVAADDGKVYLLKWHRTLDVWLMMSVFDRLGNH